MIENQEMMENQKTTPVYQVVEKFVSINGEGRRAGELAVFIRMKGCNLRCTYCDTLWANEADCESTEMTVEEIVSYIEESKVRNVTLTGGEPLLRAGMAELITAILNDPQRRVEIETNGSVDLSPYCELERRPSFTMDYKVPDSGMEHAMHLSNMEKLSSEDTVKFVVSSRSDMERALEIIEKYDLRERTAVYFSPVFGRIEPVEMVDFLMEKKLNDVKIQIQLHKVIWDPQKRGV
ncbi:putative 7-carboxy-7-deazaguanine synthase QueE [Brotaphodocola sp.]|uniref:putative 7-carboxy-7-deazaguanine synthase QueE n=1 Tax=Brotaphodocola sp. TaxID=3073577 RepID=UPI003D7D42CC